jgi:hypothetical protein
VQGRPYTSEKLSALAEHLPAYVVVPCEVAAEALARQEPAPGAQRICWREGRREEGEREEVWGE